MASVLSVSSIVEDAAHLVEAVRAGANGHPLKAGLSRILARFQASDRVDLVFKVRGLDSSSKDTGRGDG
jgi:hypothetical protein